MWNTPKKVTEMDRIKKGVAYRKRLAEEKGLDRLLLDAYHRSVRYYPIWIRSEREKKYVYPEVAMATETITKDISGDTFITEFSIGERKYKIISERRGNILAHDVYYVLTLFLGGEKLFAVSEQHDVALRGRHYYTLHIDAYASEDWVEDFRKIKSYQEKVEKEEAEAESADDPEVMQRLRKDFNLDDGRIIRFHTWPRYKVYRLLLLLIILILAFFAFLEFRTLVH